MRARSRLSTFAVVLAVLATAPVALLAGPPQPDDERAAAPAPSAAPPASAAPTQAENDSGEDQASTSNDRRKTIVTDKAVGALPWLKGSTHVHAKPSGDSSTPIAEVIEWYHKHHYNFIALTDHNRVSEVGTRSTAGQQFVRGPDNKAPLIVLAGVELTHNPTDCDPPPPEATPKCRIHVNAIGVTKRPKGKIKWAERKSNKRTDMYAKAMATVKNLGSNVAQINHPQWAWGMTESLLINAAKRGALLFEIANVQFHQWNGGDADHPSTEALWDAALVAGAKLWGVASDDAHSYDGKGIYPAGGGFVMVNAKPHPAAIVTALRKGAFYSSTGVLLSKLSLDKGKLVIAVAKAVPDAGAVTIDFVENGKVVESVAGDTAMRELPAKGYLRAVVTRADGAKAWTQPSWR